jgi:hypothetical protein
LTPTIPTGPLARWFALQQKVSKEHLDQILTAVRELADRAVTAQAWNEALERSAVKGQQYKEAVSASRYCAVVGSPAQQHYFGSTVAVRWALAGRVVRGDGDDGDV